MIQPPYLKKGDTVAIVATARKISVDEIQAAIQLLTSWGLKARIGATIGLEYNQFAGSDEARTRDMQEALDATEVNAIWFARGGYGSVRIMDQLSFNGFKNHPKWLIGYSDVTVFHNLIHNLGYASLHATMPVSVESNSVSSLARLKKALFGESLHYELQLTSECRQGKGRGEIVGGNLSMLYSILGTETSIDTRGKILFIEDLDEYLYHIDRMVMNLKRNGYFEELQGLIVGGMTDMNDNTIPFGKSAKEIIREIVSPYNFPVVFEFPAGHVNNNNALVLGRTATLEVNKNTAILAL